MPEWKHWQVALFLAAWLGGAFMVIWVRQGNWASWAGQATAWWLGFLWTLLVFIVVGLIEHRRVKKWWRAAKRRTRGLRKER